MEAAMDRQILAWLQKIKQKWVSKPGLSRDFDIGRRIQLLTVDIITKFCLGTEFGCVAEDDDLHDFLATVQQGNGICQYFSVLLEMNTLLYYSTKLPLIGSLITPKPEDKSGIGRIMGVSLQLQSHSAGGKAHQVLIYNQIVREAVENRDKSAIQERKAMLSRFLESGVPEHQVPAEIVIAM